MTGYRLSYRRLLLSVITACVILTAATPALKTGCGLVWAEETDPEDDQLSGRTGFMKKKGEWYYLIDGKKQKGWITVGGRTYFARKKGKDKYKLVKGWLKKNKKWYYFREKGKRGKICSMVSGRTMKVNGIACIFNKDGSLKRYKYAGKKKGFIQKIGEMARDNQAKNNILASLVTAQACLETGYGRSIHHNNLFGIRSGYSYRRYSSWEKSLKDYTKFMQSYVPEVFGVRNSSRACWIVGRSGYAQARNYGSALLNIIQSQNLTRFNKWAAYTEKCNM